VERAFAILEAVAPAPLGVTDIARATGLAKGTVARLLATLEAQGAVAREPDSRYRLGPTIGALAGSAASGRDLVAIARPELERLAASVGEAAGLAVAEGTNVRYIAQVSTAHEVQVRDWTGTTAPMHAVSSGHVFLAALSRNELRALLPDRLDSLTPHTITRRAVLERRLADVRRYGHAWVHDEFADGISSVAAPIRDRDGATVAAVHIHGPSYRFPHEGSEALIGDDVVASARRVSEGLGLERSGA
jgi:DNA-binding IclR family transcriptional regulator